MASFKKLKRKCEQAGIPLPVTKERFQQLTEDQKALLFPGVEALLKKKRALSLLSGK